MERMKNTIKKENEVLTGEELQEKNQKINDLSNGSQSSETIKDMNDSKLINKSFKNVHIEPADEQEFSNNTLYKKDFDPETEI